MAVDRAARDRLAFALAAFMRGEVDNFALDDACFESVTDDRTVDELGRLLWFFYDDCKPHRISVAREGWELLRRCVAFLRSDLELPERQPQSIWLHRGQLWGVAAAASIAVAGVGAWNGNPFCLLIPAIAVGVPFSLVRWAASDADEPLPGAWFPFSSEAQWRAHERLLAAESIPSYDPRLHDRPIRGRFESAVLWVPATLLGVPLLALACLLPRRVRIPSDPTLPGHTTPASANASGDR